MSSAGDSYGETYGHTKADASKMESKTSLKHGGNVPADSMAAGIQSLVDAGSKNKDEVIAERQANLPLPDQPPRAGDFNSADASIVDVGSGFRQDDMSAGGAASSAGLRGPATVESAVRVDGDEMKTGTAGLSVGRGTDAQGRVPSDAVTRDKAGTQGTVDTKNPDFGYPKESDPSSGTK